MIVVVGLQPRKSTAKFYAYGFLSDGDPLWKVDI